MTDREKLVKIKKEVMSEANSYARMKKENVLVKLIASTERETGKLWGMFVIPKYEHDEVFMKQTLTELGYSPTYTEMYNHFYDELCYIVER